METSAHFLSEAFMAQCVIVFSTGGNQLSGSLPADLFANSPNVRVARLMDNPLSGSLYAWSLPSIEVLLLGGLNLYLSTIPDQFFDGMPKLQQLDISRAALVGSIPAPSQRTFLNVSFNLVSVPLQNM
jgi:hypothetical protein